MTIKEFLEDNRKLAIHCNTKEKAIILCDILDSLGQRWSPYVRYSERTFWDVYECETCYTNKNTYSSREVVKSKGYKVLDYNSIEDLEEK